jgi:hypothetical protein
MGERQTRFPRNDGLGRRLLAFVPVEPALMKKTLSSKTIVWVELIPDVFVAIVKLAAGPLTRQRFSIAYV